MLQQLLNTQARLEQHLLPGYYTFIGPVEQNLMQPFMRRANDIAPVVAFSRSIHDVLSNKQAIQRALEILPANEPLRIFVVQRHKSDVLLHDTIEGYCEKNNINFQP